MKRIATTLLVAGLMATPMLALPPPAFAAVSVGISIGIAPPPLPIYAQPVGPGPGYLWTPGYWAWDPGYGNYYWVPGAWVMPPAIGLLWTPGWWGWSTGYYRWHHGYWGQRVGFYGGINYGHGYSGVGYVGGEWRGRDFYYNRAVNNVNVTTTHNLYVNRTVVNNVYVNRASYNGGRGGISSRPTAAQRAIANGHHWSPTSMQTRQRDVAMKNPAQRFKSNHGRPAVFATQRVDNSSILHAVRAPAATHSQKEAAPEHHGGMVAATHAKTTPASEHPRSLVTAPHSKTATTPNGERRVVEAPRNRAQPARAKDQSPRAERAAPVHTAKRAEARQPRPRTVDEHAPHKEAPRNAASAHRKPAPAQNGQHGKAQPKKKPKQDNGGHDR